ncbi:PAS domain S-box protein [Pseudoalteromonas sp. S2755]|uniref:PAS domain S-box protein n=1 Tax=Pseudoalteromonas sp. S2755 TaxID=2066523 RepID=UPI00110ADB6E|nr:PAS domain S-box protein [Pseudoalteromonas sp. S2755]TMN33055.1 hypothetical protein CWC03_20925 [Pseudoalteromonas sp. S2755]
MMDKSQKKQRSQPSFEKEDLILQALRLPVLGVDIDGKLIYFNQCAKEVFNILDSNLGTSLYQLLSISGDEQSQVQEAILEGQEATLTKPLIQSPITDLADAVLYLSPIIDNSKLIGSAIQVSFVSPEMQKDIESSHFRAIVESSDDAIISKDLNGIVKSWNQGAEKIFGYTEEEMIGQPMIKVFPEDRLHEEALILHKLSIGEKVDHFRTIRRHKNGTLIHVSATISPILDSEGNVVGASKVARDITTQVEVERLTREYDTIVQTSNDAIINQSLTGEILSWNPAAEQLLGYLPNEVIGKSIYAIIPKSAHRAHKEALTALNQGKRLIEARTIYLNKQGEQVKVSQNLLPIYDASNATIIGALQLARDSTEEEQEKAEIWKKANYDALTGITNRDYFITLAKQSIASVRTKDSEKQLYLAFIDVDSFKSFNDTYGHKIGDNVLIEIAKVLEKNCRSEDLVGRFAGDEFVVLVKSKHSQSDISKFFARIVSEVNKPVVLDGKHITMGISVGVAGFPNDTSTFEDLLEKADLAMYSAKKAGKGRVIFYEQLAKK